MADPLLPLAGLTVIDASTLLAGPFAARMLADFGAEVVKVEHPSGDPLRRFGRQRDGVPLWWKVFNRNKKSVVLNLGEHDGAERFRELAAQADVLIENFRPGTLERWGLGPDVLTAANPRLVVTRVTAFGQSGPYRRKPGFGTLAEAMSGLAAMSGEPDGPPLLPPFPLGDAVAGLHAACATLIALRARDRDGHGQVADVAIAETLIGSLGAQLTEYDQLGVKPARLGNRSNNNAPRGVYQCRDGGWVAVSAPATSVAERVLRLVGRPELTAEPWFATGAGRAGRRELIDDAVGRWVAAHDRDEVVAGFDSADAAVAPVYDVADVLADPQFLDRSTLIRVPDEELGELLMPDVPFRLSATPGRIRWAGPRLGEHNNEILEGADAMSDPQPAHPVYRSCLYVPGHQPDRIRRAYESAADAVIIDLEDAVPVSHKAIARQTAADITSRPTPKPTFVRLNSTRSGLCEQDVLAVAGVGLTGVRLAKTERTSEVRLVARLLRQAGCEAVIHVLIESAAGLENASRLATASPAVGMLGLGESDLRADLYADMDGATMDATRTRVIIASRAAGLPNPLQSVFPDPRNPEGLLATSRHGKRLGFIGRMAIHPSQVPVIHSVYTPQPHEIEEALEICSAVELAAARDQTIVINSKGKMVGPPAIANARQTLRLAAALELVGNAS